MFQFWTKVLRSFRYALQGWISAVRERNMKVHLLALSIVLLVGSWLSLTQLEWIIVLLLSALVISAEMINTSLEELANITRDELKLSYAATRRARDTAAGAVLVVAFVAAIIGSTIFVPKLMVKLSLIMPLIFSS